MVKPSNYSVFEIARIRVQNTNLRLTGERYGLGSKLNTKKTQV